MNPVQIKLATSESELIEIKNLQRINLKGNLSSDEKKTEGFLTAEYSLSFLKKINQDSPAVIAKKNKVVGYALAVSKKIGKQNKLLNHLINEFDNQKYKDIKLVNENYIVVGQLCLDKSIRGMGYVEKIYSKFRKTYKNWETTKETAQELKAINDEKFSDETLYKLFIDSVLGFDSSTINVPEQEEVVLEFE